MVTAGELAELQRMALDAVRGVLRAPDAKPADILRAAEIVAKLEAPTGAASGNAHSASDAELLAIARGQAHGARRATGEGGTPRERGPAESRAGAVPSQAHGERSEPIALPDVQEVVRVPPPRADVPRETPRASRG